MKRYLKVYPKIFSWRPSKDVTSEQKAVKCDPSEEGAITDLFGDTIKVVNVHQKQDLVCVTIKLTRKEFEMLEKMADKFGMSKSRYCRDAVRQMLYDHECLLHP